jgi:hypothetical protein
MGFLADFVPGDGAFDLSVEIVETKSRSFRSEQSIGSGTLPASQFENSRTIFFIVFKLD